MKILCSDETGKDKKASSGTAAHCDEFVMCGLMVDAKNFFEASKELEMMFAKVTNKRNVEFKVKDLMKGKGRYKKFNERKRRNILRSICGKVNKFDVDIFAIGLSYSSILSRAEKEGDKRRSGMIAWISAGVYICALIQNRMQYLEGDKGRTFVNFDYNDMVKYVNSEVNSESNFYDDLCANGSTNSFNHSNDRFGLIADKTVYDVDSENSSLVRMADTICYVYRRYLELKSTSESDEKRYYRSLFITLEKRRQRLGNIPDSECLKFYNAIKHRNWGEL